MLIRFPHTSILAVLKWKQGERTALSTARNVRGRLHVLFDMPPAGDFDHEKQRPLTPTEHIRLFGPRLQRVWGQWPAFVDAAMIDDELHRQGLTQHPLTELLERARLSRALALPATSIGRSKDYQRATRRFMEANPELPICIRAVANDWDSDAFASELTTLLRELGCQPQRVFLVLDFKGLAPLSEAALDEFAPLLAERISELPFLHRWMGLAVALSSFPAAVKLKPGENKSYPRADLLAYEKLISNPKGLLRTPMFGDYAVDTSPVQKPQRRTPSAHIRYSTRTSYIVEKGHSVRKPHGYEAIRPVARALVARSEYAGPSYSEGDRFFDRLAYANARTGSAATWRWASTDHHLTQNVHAINSLFGITEVAKSANTRDSAANQGVLFPESASPPTAPRESVNEPTMPSSANSVGDGDGKG